jgi:hypothetical protein
VPEDPRKNRGRVFSGGGRPSDDDGFLGDVSDPGPGRIDRNKSINVFGRSLDVPFGGDDRRSRPLYRKGDEVREAPDSRREIIDLQRKLVAAGLLDRGEFLLGSWDAKTRAAFKELLTIANYETRSWDHTLSGREGKGGLVRQGQRQADREALRAGRGALDELPPLELTRPEDLRAIAREAAITGLGRRLTSEQEASFIAAWHQMERDGYQVMVDSLGDDDDAVFREYVGAGGEGERAEALVRFMNPEEFETFEAGSRGLNTARELFPGAFQ